MAVNKVQTSDGTPLIDISDSTITKDTVVVGYRGYGKDGETFTGKIPIMNGKTVTPGYSQQIVVPSKTYVGGDVLVQGDTNLVPENIPEGITIFGVSGNRPAGAKIVTGSTRPSGSKLTIALESKPKIFIAQITSRIDSDNIIQFLAYWGNYECTAIYYNRGFYENFSYAVNGNKNNPLNVTFSNNTLEITRGDSAAGGLSSYIYGWIAVL